VFAITLNLNGIDVCPVKKYQLQSFGFVISSSFRKIFNIKTQDLANECIRSFNCAASESVTKRKKKLLCKYNACDSDICSLLLTKKTKTPNTTRRIMRNIGPIMFYDV